LKANERKQMNALLFSCAKKQDMVYKDKGALAFSPKKNKG
jgi:hypothetical protein